MSTTLKGLTQTVPQGEDATWERWSPVVLFVVALAVNVCGIGWGLPNGNETWANDAIQPGAPLSILHRVLVSEPWNSGWFWFKYPMGHVFVLGAVYAPYLAGLMLTGGSALLPGLDQFFHERLGIPVRIAQDPQRTVIRGAAICAEHLDRWRDSLDT